MSLNAEAMEQKTNSRKKAGFDKWISEPMVRMGLSMIPAGDREDALRMLLQSAFDSGFAHGAGDVISSFVEGMMKDRPTQPPR